MTRSTHKLQEEKNIEDRLAKCEKNIAELVSILNEVVNYGRETGYYYWIDDKGDIRRGVND